ncbi:MAG: hypothetical protein P8O07_06680 [Crocinitomicaceae bacterium]|nr:hypothetical protein [Crocinitomicaceae bacterium]
MFILLSGLIAPSILRRRTPEEIDQDTFEVISTEIQSDSTVKPEFASSDAENILMIEPSFKTIVFLLFCKNNPHKFAVSKAFLISIIEYSDPFEISS